MALKLERADEHSDTSLKQDTRNRSPVCMGAVGSRQSKREGNGAGTVDQVPHSTRNAGPSRPRGTLHMLKAFLWGSGVLPKSLVSLLSDPLRTFTFFFLNLSTVLCQRESFTSINKMSQSLLVTE